MFKECSKEEIIVIKDLVRVAELARLMCTRLAQLEPTNTHVQYLSINDEINHALDKLKVNGNEK